MATGTPFAASFTAGYTGLASSARITIVDATLTPIPGLTYGTITEDAGAPGTYLCTVAGLAPGVAGYVKWTITGQAGVGTTTTFSTLPTQVPPIVSVPSPPLPLGSAGWSPFGTILEFNPDSSYLGDPVFALAAGSQYGLALSGLPFIDAVPDSITLTLSGMQSPPAPLVVTANGTSTPTPFTANFTAGYTGLAGSVQLLLVDTSGTTITGLTYGTITEDSVALGTYLCTVTALQAGQAGYARWSITGRTGVGATVAFTLPNDPAAGVGITGGYGATFVVPASYTSGLTPGYYTYLITATKSAVTTPLLASQFRVLSN